MSGKCDIDKLTDACRRGDVATVQTCLAKGVNVNSKNVFRDTPLITAVYRNQREIVEILLVRDDLDIAVTNPVGNTVLHYACFEGKADCVALLGQDRRMTRQIINRKNKFGSTALMVAVLYGHLSCVEEMAKLDVLTGRLRMIRG